MNKWTYIIIILIAFFIPLLLIKMEYYPSGYNYKEHEDGIEIQRYNAKGFIESIYVARTWGYIGKDGNKGDAFIPHHAIKDIKEWYDELYIKTTFLLAGVFALFMPKRNHPKKNRWNLVIVLLLLINGWLEYQLITNYPDETKKELVEFINEYEKTD